LYGERVIHVIHVIHVGGCCVRSAATPHVLVSQCQTSADKYAYIQPGSWWQVIKKATVRRGSGFQSPQLGKLKVGLVIKTLLTKDVEVILHPPT
jgi:hypothetical protein